MRQGWSISCWQSQAPSKINLPRTYFHFLNIVYGRNILKNLSEIHLFSGQIGNRLQVVLSEMAAENNIPLSEEFPGLRFFVQIFQIFEESLNQDTNIYRKFIFDL